MVVTLSSSDPTKVTVPASVTIPAGEWNAYFEITGVTLTTLDPNIPPVTVNATAPGFDAPSTKLAVNVVDPEPTIIGLQNTTSTHSERDGFQIRLNTAGAIRTCQYPVVDMRVKLSVVDASDGKTISNIVPAIYGSDGSEITEVDFKAGDLGLAGFFYVGTPTALGTYKVKAEIVNSGQFLSATQNVVEPRLEFGGNFSYYRDYTAYKGFMSSGGGDLTVYRTTAGGVVRGPALDVTLTSSTTQVGVPSIVTIPEGEYFVTFPMTGVDTTLDQTPLYVNAAATGYLAPWAPLKVYVVNPRVSFENMDFQRSTAGERDSFIVNVMGGGAQVAAGDLFVNLDIVEGSPDNAIVDGFYVAATGGDAVTQVTIPKGSFRTWAYIGIPTKTGNYKVKASVVGGVTGTSPRVTVTP